MEQALQPEGLELGQRRGRASYLEVVERQGHFAAQDDVEQDEGHSEQR